MMRSFDEQAQQYEQRRPPIEEKGQHQLRVNFAVAFIVLMMLGWLARCMSDRVFARILCQMLKIVQILQRPGAQRQEAGQQEDGCCAFHEMIPDHSEQVMQQVREPRVRSIGVGCFNVTRASGPCVNRQYGPEARVT